MSIPSISLKKLASLIGIGAALQFGAAFLLKRMNPNATSVAIAAMSVEATNVTPMSDDRRSGQRLSPNEYLEVFASKPNEITVLLRRDHGDYWVLSREMFSDVPGAPLANGAALTEADAGHIASTLRAQIDRTRYLLGERLRAN